MLKYLRMVIGPSLWYAVLVGSAFGGIGGMSALGAAASDRQINRLLQLAGELSAIAFIIALIVFTLRTRKQSVEH